jgi:hypothetical protein
MTTTETVTYLTPVVEITIPDEDDPAFSETIRATAVPYDEAGESHYWRVGGSNMGTGTLAVWPHQIDSLIKLLERLGETPVSKPTSTE